jgi:hypothetical protein
MSAFLETYVPLTSECFVCPHCGAATRMIMQVPTWVCLVCRASVVPPPPVAPTGAPSEASIPVAGNVVVVDDPDPRPVIPHTGRRKQPRRSEKP